MIPAPPHLRFEAWKDQIRKMGGRFDPQVIDPKTFAGWVRPISAYGLIAAEVGSNAHVVEHTHRHVRVGGADHYVVLFQLAGRSAMTYNEEAVRVGVGDVAFVDMGRPATFFAGNAGEVLEYHGSSFAAPGPGIASRIRAAGWALPAQRNVCRPPSP